MVVTLVWCNWGLCTTPHQQNFSNGSFDLTLTHLEYFVEPPVSTVQSTSTSVLHLV